MFTECSDNSQIMSTKCSDNIEKYSGNTKNYSDYAHRMLVQIQRFFTQNSIIFKKCSHNAHRVLTKYSDQGMLTEC